MKFEKCVGLEAEFFVLDREGQIVLPPPFFDRDDFPLLGEIRGKPGDNTASTVSNFLLRKMEIEKTLSTSYDGKSLSVQPFARVGLKTYQEATRACTTPKNESVGKIQNVYGTEVTDYSDQIIKSGRIQGINASCGLHIHFSCRAVDRVEVTRPKYTNLQLPIAYPDAAAKGAKELLRPCLSLYKFEGYDVEEVLEASASLLNRPTVEWMVRELDREFFDRFAPPTKERTKYRQAGFYEMKEHGFEYRSLPACAATLDALPEIVEKAFELLDYASA